MKSNIPIGWNPITKKFDSLNDGEFSAHGTPDKSPRRVTSGVKTTKSGHRYDDGSDIWDNSETRVYWWWEDNA